MTDNKSNEDAEYGKLCHDCQEEEKLDRPQIHDMIAFKGDFETPTCDKCGQELLL